MIKKHLFILLSLLLLSCSKDDSSTNGATTQERLLFGKWYNDFIETSLGSFDNSCSTCYWEFLSIKNDTGDAYGGMISIDGSAQPAFIWSAGEDGQIYVMLDVMMKVKSVTNLKLILEGGGSTWTFHKEGTSSNTTSETKTYIPDDNFEQALIDLGYDDVLDNYVLTSNISSITELYVNDMGIYSLQGIQDFKSLRILYAYNNHISNIDVSYNNNLSVLRIWNNQLQTIDVSNNPNLEDFGISNNLLQNVDVSHNNNLLMLNVWDNKLNSIDVSNNTKLTYLNISQNNINSINITNNLSLQRLLLYQTPISYLNISLHNKIYLFYVNSTNLTTLDVSNNYNLQTLHCEGNQINCIRVSQNQFNSIPTDWHKDLTAAYNLNCN